MLTERDLRGPKNSSTLAFLNSSPSVDVLFLDAQEAAAQSLGTSGLINHLGHLFDVLDSAKPEFGIGPVARENLDRADIHHSFDQSLRPRHVLDVDRFDPIRGARQHASLVIE